MCACLGCCHWLSETDPNPQRHYGRSTEGQSRGALEQRVRLLGQADAVGGEVVQRGVLHVLEQRVHRALQRPKPGLLGATSGAMLCSACMSHGQALRKEDATRRYVKWECEAAKVASTVAFAARHPRLKDNNRLCNPREHKTRKPEPAGAAYQAIGQVLAVEAQEGHHGKAACAARARISTLRTLNCGSDLSI